MAAVARASAVIVIGTVLPPDVPSPAAVLPIANVVEEEGTLTNLRGHVQRFLQAKAAPALARPSWYVLADLVGAMGERAEFYTAGAVFDALAASEGAFAGLSYDKLALKGRAREECDGRYAYMMPFPMLLQVARTRSCRRRRASSSSRR